MARATGRTLRATALAPYHQTLFEFIQLLEEDRIRHALDRLQNLEVASYIGVAFSEPKKLRDIYEELANGVAPKTTTEEALDRAADIIEHMKRRHQREAAEQPQ